MYTQFKIALKNKSNININAKLTVINRAFIDMSELMDSPIAIFLKIKHQQINTTINLPLKSHYVLLYFSEDENYKDHLKFDGANYSSGTTGSFTICTQYKHMLLMPSPLNFKIEQVDKLLLSSEV